VVAEQAMLKKVNLQHSELISSNEFRLHTSKVERERIINLHQKKIFKTRSLLVRLLNLSGSDLGADVNADVDDVLES